MSGGKLWLIPWLTYHHAEHLACCVTDALKAPALYRVRDPANRLPREEVVPQVRYRVAQQGQHQVAVYEVFLPNAD
jgi:hypothetical protein